MKEIIVGKNEAGQRMDKLLAKVLNQCSKSFLYKMLRKKNIKLNQKKADGRELLKEGDCIQIYFSDETFRKFSEKDAKQELSLPDDFQVIYEDEDMILLNKWRGILSQKASADDISMNDYLLSYMLSTNKISPEQLNTFTPSICNRLDRNTTGLLVCGASLKGLQILSKAFKERTIGKYYYALVKGKVTKGKHIKGYLKKDSSNNKVHIFSEKEAFSTGIATPIETEYEVLWYCEEQSLLKVHLITGKTHQIRAHLASMGHPIAGDGKYGDSHYNKMIFEQYGVKHQLLHAGQLVFPENFALDNLSGHTFQAPFPKDFQNVLDALNLKI